MQFHALPIAALALGVMAKKDKSSSSTTPSMTVNTETATFFQPYGTDAFDFGILPLWETKKNTKTYTYSDFAVSVKDASPCSSTLEVYWSVEGVKGSHTSTVTDGISSYEADFSYSDKTFKATATQSCKKDGTTKAVCTESRSISYSYKGQSDSTSDKKTKTYSGDDFTKASYQTASVKGGAKKLASATGTCTKSGGAAAPTVGVEVLKVVVVPAVALLGAVL